MVEIIIDVSVNKVTLPEGIAAGDVGSVNIRLINTPAEWSDKKVYAMISQHGESEVYAFIADGGKWMMKVPAQHLKVRGSFAVVAFATSIESAYRDVIPTVWVEVQEGLPIHADILPADDEVGRLTAMIELAETYASQLGDMEAIKKKVDGIEEGAEVNVQADWAETDPESDAFIPNKPKIDAMLDPSSDNAVANSAVAVSITAIGDALGNVRQNLGLLESEVSKIGKIEADIGNLLLGIEPVVDSINTLAAENTMQGAELKRLDTAKANKAELKAVATSGSYADLSAVPVENVGEVESISVFDETKYREKSAIYSGVYGSGITFILHVAKLGVGAIQMLLCGSVSEPVRVRQFINITGKWTKWDVPISRYDYEGEVIHETYARKDELRPEPVRILPATLKANTPYNFETINPLTLSFPTTAKDGDVIYITFLCIDDATNLTIDTSNTTDIDLIPEPYMMYEIYAKFNASMQMWFLNYSEHKIPEV